jgi:hypothetical protein
LVPGPTGPPGPQGDVGPQGPEGPAADSSLSVESPEGAFSVPLSVVVGHVVRVTGSYTADKADNGSASTYAVAVVSEKPSPVTATLIFVGVLDAFSGLTPMSRVFLGADGSTVDSGSLPGTPGSIWQQVGVAISSTALLFYPGPVVVRT